MSETPSTFRFRRYREEVALRSSLKKGVHKEDKHKASAGDRTKHDNRTRTRSSSESENDGDDGTVIQNLANSNVVVDTYGKVFTEEISTNTNDKGDISIPIENNETDHTKRREPMCVVPEGTTLLLRNLRDCRVTIHMPLPAVHFVGIENTEIVFYNKSTDGNAHVNTTIHMTDCRGKSSLQLETPAQQLRIHKAVGLGVEMMNENTDNPSRDWTRGSIILEASKGVVFSVPPLAPTEREVSSATSIVERTKNHWHQIVVKDFQWLRKGVASKNFRIEVFQIRESTGDKDCTGDPIKTTETTENRVLQQSLDSEEASDSSDSEDEL